MEIGNGFIIDVNQKDKEKLKRFVKKVSSLKLSKLDKILNQDRTTIFNQLYLQLSYDLKEEMVICLNGHLDHMRFGFKILNVSTFIRKYEEEYIIMKNVKIIKHIPHASLSFPKEISKGGILNFKEKHILKMTDIGVDFLFKDIEGIEIKAPYSRLFCDVEKFKDNSLEVMAKYGQGYIYDKYYDGSNILRVTHGGGVCIKDYANKYYDEYHQKLNDTVLSLLKEGKRVLILDIHSYSDELAMSFNNKKPFPDVCIGINDKYYDKDILKLIIRKIKEQHLSYKINYPYKGSILPSGLINNEYDGDITSIMLEINKRVYL